MLNSVSFLVLFHLIHLIDLKSDLMKTFLEEGIEMRPGISLNFSQTTRAVFPSSCTQSNPCSSPGELLSCMSGEVSLIRPMFSSRSILLGCYGKGWSPVVSQFHLKCRQEMMIFVNRSPDYYSAFPIAAPWKHYKNIKLFDSPWNLAQNSGSPRTAKKNPPVYDIVFSKGASWQDLTTVCHQRQPLL